MIVFAMILLIVLILIQSSTTTNDSSIDRVVKVENFKDSPMNLNERLTLLERKLSDINDAYRERDKSNNINNNNDYSNNNYNHERNNDDKNDYPTFEQLVVVRHDLDKLITVTLPQLEQRIVENDRNREERERRIQEEKRVQEERMVQEKKMMHEKKIMEEEKRVREFKRSIEEKMIEQERKIHERLNTLVMDRLREHLELVNERIRELTSINQRKPMSNNEQHSPLGTISVRFAWFDAQNRYLNENHDLLHRYMETVDVIVVHRITLNENRFYEHLRKVNSVDVFRPVINRRNQFLVLMVTGKGEKKKTLRASGFCLNVNLNFQHATTKSYESGDIRLLTLWGLLYDRFHVVFCAIFSLSSSLSSSSSSSSTSINSLSTENNESHVDDDDRCIILEKLMRDVQAMKDYDNPVYRSNDYRVFVLGDFDATLNKFHHLRERFRSLRCEYDSCVKGPVITSIANGYYHNVHAVTNTHILDFNATQTNDSSILVKTVFSTTKRGETNNYDSYRYGAINDSTHKRTIL